ncbi:MAG: hypothetical protein J6R02_02890 [Alistipes sp.]|nr:hypothetical protein [Alistipes sp.]
MKRSLNIMILSVVALLLGSCSAMVNSSYYGSSDLYRNDNRIQVANELKAKAEAEKAEAEARKAMWEARIAEANASTAEAEYYATTSPSYTSIVADDYESAYARRLYGFTSPTYQLPSSYYSYSTYDALRYATAYDPAQYNIMISGDQVWVEPRYITSMFGSWGATNITFGLYSSPWNFGWNIYVDPFYYTWWGYPHYSWYDWNWNICYNPYYWGYGYSPYYPGYYPYYPGYYPYYPGYYPHMHYPPRPPQPPHPGHGPAYKPGGNGHSNLNGNRHNTASRYTSPTSNKNYGGGVRSNNGSSVSRPRSGAVSTGINSSKTYRPSSGTSGTTNRGQYTGSSTRNNNSAGSSQSSNYQRSNNYRQSSSSSSSSSSYRQSSSSSSNRSTMSSSSSYRSSSSGYSSGSSSSSRSGGTTSSRR